MISADHVRLMARYNRWQNESLYGAASGLPDAARCENRGAFFGSIHATLSHLIWGDMIWMHRFSGSERPKGGIAESPQFIQDWDELAARRQRLDTAIVDWAARLDPAWLEASTEWITSSTNTAMTKQNALLVSHFFNHQTHHRGQVHAMLTAAGAKPDRTDLVFME
ncbi:MAG: DinB family protein [Beijerinckiaceae bacterium]